MGIEVGKKYNSRRFGSFEVHESTAVRALSELERPPQDRIAKKTLDFG
jgi:hypothetical protein